MDYAFYNTSSLSPVTIDATALSQAPLLSYRDAICWWAVYPFVVLELLYFGLSLLFALLDFRLSPAALAAAKLQPHRLPAHTPPDIAAYKQAAATALYNHCVGSLPALLLFALAARQLRLPLSWEGVSWAALLWQLAVVAAVEEVLFYYAHRLLHSPLLFRAIHSVHHSFTAPVAVAATHCHLVEHVACNLVPMLAGTLLARAAWPLYVLWCGTAIVNTLCVHSGYKWWPLQANNHDRHHSTNKCAFGALGILDWLHGTRYVDLVKKQQP